MRPALVMIIDGVASQQFLIAALPSNISAHIEYSLSATTTSASNASPRLEGRARGRLEARRPPRAVHQSTR